MNNQSILKNLRNSNNAVVGIVVTVLLIGLILTVMVMVNTLYVPQWLENSEATHMDEVSNQFTQLKYALDIQSIVNDSSAMTTSVSLGTKEIPFFDTGRTFDTLEIITNAITIDFTPGGTYTSDSIRYTSRNSYFVDQSYIYEAGALIIGQDEKSVLYAGPSLVITEYGKNITFYITEIEGLIGKTFASGYGLYPIFTSVATPSNDIVLNNVSEITITTEYPKAWETVFEQVMGTVEFDYDISTSNNEMTLSFNIVDNNFFIRNKDINTQIAFGLAE